MPRYILDRLIGEGGMASVHRARALGESGFARVVAVKRLLPQLARDAALQKRFIDEARIAGALRHPCIVGVTDFYEDHGVQCLVMEHVDGVSVEHLCQRGLAGRFVPPAAIARIVHDLARALAYAHREGVLHRDVSGCNVLVSREGEVKLADFGLADARGRVSSTDPGTFSGKLLYLSPERRRGEKATTSDDLYALGVVLRRLLDAADPRERSRAPGPMLAEVAAALTCERALRIGSAPALLEILRPIEQATPEELAALVLANPEPRRAPGWSTPLSAEELDDTTESTAPGGPAEASGPADLARSLAATIPAAPLLAGAAAGPLSPAARPRRQRWPLAASAILALLLAMAATLVLALR